MEDDRDLELAAETVQQVAIVDFNDPGRVGA
jgi:hypothetical protein